MFYCDIKRTDSKPSFTVRFVSKTDSKPVFEALNYLKSLSKAESAGIKALFSTFLEYGYVNLTHENMHPPTDAPDLLQFRKGRHRILCFKDGDTMIVCTHGFFKKTGPTPLDEVIKARKIRDKYFESKESGNLKSHEVPTQE
jgi:phage-related protein